MSSDRPLVDVHVHLYPDAPTAARAKQGYAIWEYGEDPGISFDDGVGVADELDSRFVAAGFDHVVGLVLYDVAAERADALARLEPGLAPPERQKAEAVVEELLPDALVSANLALLDAAREHRVLVPVIGLDPCLLDERRLVPLLLEMAERGALGVKLHPVAQGFRPDDPRLDGVYRTCSELGLVLISHAGPGHRDSATARPSTFARVLERWPNLRLVLAHLGGASFAESEQLADDFPQVVFDCSEIIEWAGTPAAPTHAALASMIERIGPDRVMLGSDFPWYDPVATAAKVDDLPGLSASERAAVLGESAVQLFGLS